MIFFILLVRGGGIIVGTPSEYKHLRKFLGSDFNSFLFSVQHPWVFTEKSLKIIFEKAGFKNVTIKQYTLYGIGNFLAWLKEKKPTGNITYPYISTTIDEAWKSNLAETGNGDYLVVYASK